MENDMKEINSGNLSDPRVKYLVSEVNRMNNRLDFLKEQQKELVASGRPVYLFEFGSIDDIRQRFENAGFTESYTPEHYFTFIAKWILEKDTTPSKKIKMLNNLITVFEEFKPQV